MSISNDQRPDFIIDTPYLNEEKVDQYRQALTEKISVEPDQFEIENQFEKEWYPNNSKYLKGKLGKLSFCSFKD